MPDTEKSENLNDDRKLSVKKTFEEVIKEELIKNATGTTDKECACGTWIAHWKNNQIPAYDDKIQLDCFVYDCGSPAEVGAHVYRRSDRKQYIIPMCRSCNGKHGENLEILNTAFFIPANIKNKCEEIQKEFHPAPLLKTPTFEGFVSEKNSSLCVVVLVK